MARPKKNATNGYGSLFEEDYLIRTLGRIAHDPEIALTELVANAWDAGALTVDPRGDATGELVASAVAPGTLLIGISAEQRADLAAPSAPQSGVILSGQLPDPTPRATDHLSANLGTPPTAR